MRVSATEAKNQFVSLCAQAKREPVFVEEAGHAARKEAFEAEFADWIADQNAGFKAGGIPGADLRPW
jgi:hypothetical protein